MPMSAPHSPTAGRWGSPPPRKAKYGRWTWFAIYLLYVIGAQGAREPEVAGHLGQLRLAAAQAHKVSGAARSTVCSTRQRAERDYADPCGRGEQGCAGATWEGFSARPVRRAAGDTPNACMTAGALPWCRCGAKGSTYLRVSCPSSISTDARRRRPVRSAPGWWQAGADDGACTAYLRHAALSGGAERLPFSDELTRGSARGLRCGRTRMPLGRDHGDGSNVDAVREPVGRPRRIGAAWKGIGRYRSLRRCPSPLFERPAMERHERPEKSASASCAVRRDTHEAGSALATCTRRTVRATIA